MLRSLIAGSLLARKGLKSLRRAPDDVVTSAATSSASGVGDDHYSPQSDGGAQHPKKVYMRKHLRNTAMRPDSDGNSTG